jgi:branched-chain amino acid transport system permease protein
VNVKTLLRADRGTAVRLGLLSLVLVVGLLRPLIRSADVAEKLSNRGIIDAFGAVRWVAVPVLIVLIWVAFLKQQRRALVASMTLAFVLLAWLVLGYERVASEQASKVNPHQGWVITFVALLATVISNLPKVVGGSERARWVLGKVGRTVGPILGHRRFPFIVAGVLFLAGMFVVPAVFDPFWIANFTQLAIFAILASSAGMLYGRVGMVSLGQVAPYGIGCWVTVRLSFATDLPYPLLLLIGGAAAMVIGTVIGMPALRVSGLYLALVSLMLVAGVEIVLNQTKFANGGEGFKGLVEGSTKPAQVRRPSFAEGDTAYFRFAVVVAFVMLGLAALALYMKPGRAWAAIRQSEAAALTGGIDITRYKLYAFALASFMAGVAGGLFGGLVRSSIGSNDFSRQAAIFLIAAVIMGGVDSLWGGVLAAFFAKCLLDFLTQNVVGHQFWNNFSLSLFGFGLMMNLIQGTKAMEKKGLLA